MKENCSECKGGKIEKFSIGQPIKKCASGEHWISVIPMVDEAEYLAGPISIKGITFTND